MFLPANPSGWMGRIFGKLMESTNTDAYQKTIQALAPSDNERFLEIGFGTGCCAEMLLSTTTGVGHKPKFYTSHLSPLSIATVSNMMIERLQNFLTSFYDHILARQ